MSQDVATTTKQERRPARKIQPWSFVLETELSTYEMGRARRDVKNTADAPIKVMLLLEGHILVYKILKKNLIIILN